MEDKIAWWEAAAQVIEFQTLGISKKEGEKKGEGERNKGGGRIGER